MQTKRLLLPAFPYQDSTEKIRSIAYTDWGDPDNAHVVICVHGLTRNCRDFDYLARVLEKDCRVICVDVVGRGESDWLDNAEDYDCYLLYIADAVSLVTHIQAQYTTPVKLDWVGISMGALIGMMLAVQPEISIPVHRLVMSDIGPFIPLAALSRLSEYVGKDIRFNSFDAFLAYLKKISATFGPLTDAQWHHLAIHSIRRYADGTLGFCYDPKIAISFEKHVLEDINLWEHWDKLRSPTLVLRGSESDILLAETAAEMQIRGAKAKVVELPGVGHAPLLMDCEQIKIVKEFLLAPE